MWLLQVPPESNLNSLAKLVVAVYGVPAHPAKSKPATDASGPSFTSENGAAGIGAAGDAATRTTVDEVDTTCVISATVATAAELTGGMTAPQAAADGFSAGELEEDCNVQY